MKPEISVIVPVVERVGPIEELYAGYRGALEKTGRRFEFIFVLDGGFGRLKEPLLRLRERGEPITTITFAKWFGEATSISAGFEYAQGDYILILPSSFQIEADDIPKLVAEAGDVDIVLARRDPKTRKLLKRLQTGVFHILMHRATGMGFHDAGCDVRYFRRRVLEEISLYGDQQLFFPYLAAARGFKTREVVVQASKRDALSSFHPFGLYIRKLVDVLSILIIVRFTKKPLRFFGLLGVLTFGAGAVFSLVLLVQRLFFDMALANRPIVLIPALLLTLGVQIFAIGLIGEILIFTHAQQLKEYTVDEVIN